MASRNYILAHDLGTTGNKANLFDAEGKAFRRLGASLPAVKTRAHRALLAARRSLDAG